MLLAQRKVTWGEFNQKRNGLEHAPSVIKLNQAVCISTLLIVVLLSSMAVMRDRPRNE